MKGPRGIVCPRCGGQTEVIDTRANGGGIRRRRACLTAGCGGRVSTLEMQIPSGSAIDGRGLALIEVKAMKRAITALSLLEQQLACRPVIALERDEETSVAGTTLPVTGAPVSTYCVICGYADGRHHPGCEVLRNIRNQDDPQ